MNAIEIKNLHFSYGKENVLDGVSLCLKEGRLAILAGENGAGKSTLLRLLLGELPIGENPKGDQEEGSSDGSIEILGQVFYASFMVYNALPMGAGNTVFVLASSLLNCIVVRVVLAVLFNHFFGLVGIFWACAIAPASSVPLGYLYERSGVWRKTLTEGS